MRVLTKLLWNGTEIGFNKITVKRAEKIKSDYIEVIFTNDNLVLSSGIKFKQGDSLTLYAKLDESGSSLDISSSSSDLLFNGVIKEVNINKVGKKVEIKVKGVSRTYDLMNRLWSKNYSNKTTPQIIKEIIDFTSNDTSGSPTIDATIDTGYPYTSGIQGKRPDGSDFPTKNFGLAHKPVFEFIENLSQIEYTNTSAEIESGTNPCKRPFKYYIDNQDKFHWFYPTDTPNYEMVVGETTPQGSDTRRHIINGLNLTHSQFDEINFIIFKAGEDMDNVQILDFDLDPTAKSLTTADNFRSWLDITREMKRADMIAGHITFVKGDEYDYPTDYGTDGITPAWNPNITVNDDDEYNGAFREEAIRRARSRCKSLFDETGNPRWKGRITLYGELFNPTDLIKFTWSDYDMTDINLRIKTVTHNITKNSYTTTLEVEEDIEV